MSNWRIENAKRNTTCIVQGTASSCHSLLLLPSHPFSLFSSASSFLHPPSLLTLSSHYHRRNSNYSPQLVVALINDWETLKEGIRGGSGQNNKDGEERKSSLSLRLRQWEAENRGKVSTSLFSHPTLCLFCLFFPSLPHSAPSQGAKLNYKLWICPGNLTQAPLSLSLKEQNGTRSLDWLAVCLLYSFCGQMVQTEPLWALSMPLCFWIPEVGGREAFHLVPDCRRMTSRITFSLSLFFWNSYHILIRGLQHIVLR